MSVSDFSSADPFFGKITETSAGKFKADKQIIKSVSAARSIFTKLRSDHLKRILFYSEINGLLGGNPPYNPQELKAAGLQHISNFNDMSANSTYERYGQSYWNLLYNSEYMTNFVLRIKDPQATDFARTLSKNWDYVIKKYWPSFYVNVASLSAQLVKFGISPVLFPDERDPRFRVVELSRFFVPNQAQADLDMLTTVCVETEFTVQYLWGVYQEFKDKKDQSPWNTDELARVLMYIANSPLKDTASPTDWFELEKKFLSGDISYDRMYSDTVRMVSLFQKEYNGKISHYMFHRNLSYNTASLGPNMAGEDFCFFQEDQFQDMREALVIFTMNPGEYTLHENKGLGHKIFSLAQAAIQMDCSLIDGAKWAATPIIKASTLNPRDVEQIRFYPGVPTNIGTAEFVQNNLGSNLQHIIGSAQYIKSLIQFNLTYSGSDPGTPDPSEGSISPDEARMRAIKEFSILKNSVMHFYNTFDYVIINMSTKMYNSKPTWPMYEMSEEWKERCIDEGVPREIFEFKSKNGKLPKEVEVTATRVAGAGSQVALLIGLQELEAIAGSFNEDEQREYKKMYVTATVGPEYLNTFAQPPKPDETKGGSSLAGVENAVMQGGSSPVFSNDNEHVAHATTHLALGRHIMEAISQQQMDVVQADSVFNVLIPHLGEHIQAIEQNPFSRAFFEKIQPLYDQLSRYAILNRKNATKTLEANAKQQQAAQENQARVMTDEELKNMQVTNEERRKDIKLAAQNQRQERAGSAKETALFRKTEADIAVKTTTANVDNQIKKDKAITDNNADQEAAADPSGYLNKIQGKTMNPYDMEGG